MQKKILILIIALISSDVALAGISYLSYSNASFLIYSWTVLPILLWIANLVILIRTILSKKVNNRAFWFVNGLSILIALFLIYPVCIDISEMGLKNFENYGITLSLLIIIPLIMSSFAIRIRLDKGTHQS